MDKKKSENENDNNNNDCNGSLDCIDYLSHLFKKHLGKMGVILGACGAIASVFVSLGLPVASGVTLAITNCSIFVGGLSYDRLAQQNIKLNDDISEKKEFIRRITTIPSSFHFPVSSNDSLQSNNISSAISTTSTATHYDTPLQIYDLLNKNPITPKAINTENSPDTTDT